MKFRVIAAFAAATFACALPAQADDFPSHPMTMVIPFAAGGPTDILGRVIAGRMSEIMGQTVVVENVGGAGGMTGSARVANATPDGYQFVLGTVGTHAQGQTLYKSPLYNSVTDFTPVILIANVPIVLETRKDLPVNNFKEFVAYAKANQAKMQFASAGAGSATHLGCVLLNYVIGVNVTHVPYRGTGAGAAGSRRRPRRLYVRHHHHREAADRQWRGQGTGDLRHQALAGAAEPSDRG